MRHETRDNTAAAVGIVQLTVFPPAAPAYDLREAAASIARAQAEGRPVANLGRYHGQFHYHGRLTQRVTPLAREQVFGWARANPDGDLVVLSAAVVPSVDIAQNHRFIAPRGRERAPARQGALFP